jgi:hypothetical protein
MNVRDEVVERGRREETGRTGFHDSIRKHRNYSYQFHRSPCSSSLDCQLEAALLEREVPRLHLRERVRLFGFVLRLESI